MLTYTLLNLLKAPIRSLQLFIGTFLVFMLLMAAAAFQTGMTNSLSMTASEQNVILLGAGSEESLERSEVSWQAVPATKTLKGIKKVFGQPAVSPESHYNTVVKIADKEMEAMLRGVTRSSLIVYPALAISEGNFPASGEMMVGRLAWKRLGLEESDLKIGSEIIYEKQTFKVSGIFSAPKTVMESEVWMNLNDLSALSQRDSISCITVRLDTAEFDDIDLFTKKRLDLQLTVIKESDYYAKLGSFYEPILVMAWITALLIAAGALFGGLNTFYAAIKSRSKELATLQAIGYSRTKLFISLFGESCIIHALAFLVALIVSMSFFPMVHINFGSTFFSLSLNQEQVLGIFISAITLALLVILIPAWNCLHPPLSKTLNE